MNGEGNFPYFSFLKTIENQSRETNENTNPLQAKFI